MAPNSVRSVQVATASNQVVAATAAATTLAELISTLPQSWRPATAIELTTVYRVSAKLCTVQNTIAQYERHHAEGSFPPSIINSAKDPKIQFSKEFLGTENGRLTKGTIDATVHEGRKSLLAAALLLKRQELADLQSRVAFDRKRWRSTLIETAQRIGGAFGVVPRVTTDGQGEQQFVWASAPDHLVKELHMLWNGGDVFHFRAVSLARSLADRSLVDKTRNMSLKKETDVTMKDADHELTTREVVRDELDAKFKQFKSEMAGMMGTSAGKRRGTPLTPNRLLKKARPETQAWQGQGKGPAEQHHQDGWRDQARRGSEQRKEEGEQEMTVTSFLAQCSKEFRPWLAETFPSVYGSLSSQCRMKIAFALSKTWDVETVRTFNPGVFKHPDVDMPEDIEFMLACNHKFILPQTPSLDNIQEAKDRLARTVRNRWLFRDKISSDFIPKFHIPNPRWNPPRASPALEQGLEAAMRVIDDQCHQALASIAVRPAAHSLAKWSQVQDFLESNQLLAKLTDKNLGLAVFPLSWYDTTTLQMLTDTETYVHVTSIPTQRLVKILMEEVPKWRLPQVMAKYLMSKVKLVVPEFHAIPKVHKTPWALRPIVPSHSWVTTGTSEVIDHLLQPILKQFPWVVASSKDVIQQIESVQVTDTAPVWIITGDVTSFYTNIPPDDCAKVIAGAWKLYCHSSSISHSTIRRMVTFVMENNFFGYRGQRFRQVKGLAMGTSCAPTLANIYAAYHERKARVVHQEGVLLYVRYIDDILCLFQGTKEEVGHFLQKYRLGNLEVRWSVSSTRNEFLDIELIRGEQPLGLRACETRLFRKELNKHLYIPWSSAHPLHVKKGFVKAELTRLAIISSQARFFAEAKREFYSNLRRRGYPSQTLIEWFTQVHYDNRPLLLLPKPAQDDNAPLMLSGYYNPVWEYVDVNEVLKTAKRYWVKETLPSSLEVPLIRSLGRTTSLFDLISTWNKTLLLFPSGEGPGVST